MLVTPGVAFVWHLAGRRSKMYRFRFPIVVAAVLTGAGLAGTPAALAAVVAGPGAAAVGGPGWASSVPFTNQVASSSAAGGGYPVPPGQTFPNPGTCRAGRLDSNHSESLIAGKTGAQGLGGNPMVFLWHYYKCYGLY